MYVHFVLKLGNKIASLMSFSATGGNDLERSLLWHKKQAGLLVRTPALGLHIQCVRSSFKLLYTLLKSRVFIICNVFPRLIWKALVRGCTSICNNTNGIYDIFFMMTLVLLAKLLVVVRVIAGTFYSVACKSILCNN